MTAKTWLISHLCALFFGAWPNFRQKDAFCRMFSDDPRRRGGARRLRGALAEEAVAQLFSLQASFDGGDGVQNSDEDLSNEIIAKLSAELL
jgi:hypothetical protein